MAYIPTGSKRIEHLIEGLDYDRQLKTDPGLKRKIKRMLEAQLKRSNNDMANIGAEFYSLKADEARASGTNPFAPDAVIKQHPKPKTTQTPIEKIREKNRYIKT